MRARIRWCGAIGMTVAVLPAAAAQAAVQVRAPQRVERGDRFLVVMASRSGAPAALQGSVSYDHRRATLLSVTAPGAPLQRLGRSVQAVGPAQRGSAEAFGYYSCASTRCATPVRARRGNRLIVLEWQAEHAGPLRLRLGRLRGTDASGRRTTASSAAPVVTVRVLPETRRTVSHGRRRIAVPLTTATTTRARGRVDADHDGSADAIDAATVAYAWAGASRHGDACAGSNPDLDRDGCLTLADVQVAAAHARRRVPVARTASTTFTVNSESDAPDATRDGVCRTAAGDCSLRAAIEEANAAPGADTVAFAIPGAGVHTINLSSPLPALTDGTGGTTIDGHSQPGSVANDAQLTDDAQLKIAIRGTGYDGIDGIEIFSAANAIKGISFYNLRREIGLYGTGAHDNSIRGDFIGTDPGATAHADSYNLEGSGVTLEAGAAANHIGDTWVQARNVISGNARHGVATYGVGTDRNLIRNNLIGLSPDGGRSVLNQKHGIDINDGSSQTQIGGTGPLERNVISGNGNGQLNDFTAGVEISHSTKTVGNRIVGNLIGTDVTGAFAAPYTANSMYGIRVEDGVQGTVIADNVIGNSLQGAIKMDAPYTAGTVVSGNHIGLSLTGRAIANPHFAIQIAWHASRNVIGPGNVIANSPVGVEIAHPDSDRNTVTRNRMFDLGGLGIDIEPWGRVNPNDSGDRDSGANEQLNHPVIRRAGAGGVSGYACGGCTIELFRGGRAGGYGPGRAYLGGAVSGPRGHFTVPAALTRGATVTATATDGAGNTSEFSADVTVG